MKAFKLVLTSIAVLFCAMLIIGKPISCAAKRLQKKTSPFTRDSMEASKPNRRLMTNPLGMPVRMAY
jgi:hypothetical protein